MSSRYSNKRDHVLRTPLEHTVDECVKNGDDVVSMVESILQTLGEQQRNESIDSSRTCYFVAYSKALFNYSRDVCPVGDYGNKRRESNSKTP
jgi:hypothetical protein